MIPRIKNRPKGILIPVDEYSRKPIFEDKYSKYFGASVELGLEPQDKIWEELGVE